MDNGVSQLVEISNYYGRKKEYVIAGGGNTSFKDESHLYIKASGISLADIREDGFCILDRNKLNRLSENTYSDDPVKREEEVKNALMDSRINPESGLRPSVETSLHNLFEYQFVVHTHPTLVNGLMCSILAEEKTKELFGEEALYIPYSDPGFILFTIIREKIGQFRTKKGHDPKVVFIQNHGVFVAADSTGEIMGIYAGIESILKANVIEMAEIRMIPVSPRFIEAMPAIRMMLSTEKLKVCEGFHHTLIARYVEDSDTFQTITRPFNPDQMVYCLSESLFLENRGSTTELIGEAKEKINEFKTRKGNVPKVIFIRNEGVIVAEDSPVSAGYLAEMVNDFTQIAFLTENFGGPHPMTPEQVAFIENWEVENYRKKVSLGAKPSGRVENRIIVITGAAQGFGAGIAEILFAEGGNIVVADMNEEKGRAFADALNKRGKKNKAFFAKVNVSDPVSVKHMIDSAVLKFGGLDVMISNAGILRAGSLEEMDPETFELMTKVNYSGYFLCAKYAKPVMKMQHQVNPGHFMDVIQINSKSGLKGSNKNFAYAGGKFGGIGLTQSFALELMPFNIKVNSICPGNFFDGPLWSDPENGLFVQYLRAGKVPGAKTIEDVKRFYEAQVPAGRGCTAMDVVKAILYVIDQEYETGQAVPVTGGQNMLN